MEELLEGFTHGNIPDDAMRKFNNLKIIEANQYEIVDGNQVVRDPVELASIQKSIQELIQEYPALGYTKDL